MERTLVGEGLAVVRDRAKKLILEESKRGKYRQTTTGWGGKSNPPKVYNDEREQPERGPEGEKLRDKTQVDSEWKSKAVRTRVWPSAYRKLLCLISKY